MKRKGFTLIELLGVISILAIIAIIGIPVYGNIRNSVNKSVYESKVKNILSKAENYAEQTGTTVLDVQTLISNGDLEADNETGVYMDPYNNRNMHCDVVNVIYEDNQYQATITKSDSCYTQEELNSLYGMINLSLYDASGSQIGTDTKTPWVKNNPVYVRYSLKDGYQKYADAIQDITWTGEKESNCSSTANNLSSCTSYQIDSSELNNINVTIRVNLKINNVLITATASKRVQVDLQSPYVASVAYNDDIVTNQKEKVNINLSDGDGSGIDSYAVTKDNSSCDNVSWKDTTSNQVTEYLESGNYYICVRDKVGNLNTDDNRTNNKIEINNVVSGTPTIKDLSVESRDTYQSLNVRVKLNLNNSHTGVQLCISDQGFENGCQYNSYVNNTTDNKNWSIDYNITHPSSNLDGKQRTIYVTIKDSANNKVNKAVTYTPYTECSNSNKVYTDANWSACTNECGTDGTQYKNFDMRDVNTGKTCSSGKDYNACHRRDCCSSKKVGSYSSWGACSKSCGTGTRSRDVNYVSSYNGESCGTVKGESTESCNTNACSSGGGSSSDSFVYKGSDGHLYSVTESSGKQTNVDNLKGYYSSSNYPAGNSYWDSQRGKSSGGSSGSSSSSCSACRGHAYTGSTSGSSSSKGPSGHSSSGSSSVVGHGSSSSSRSSGCSGPGCH